MKLVVGTIDHLAGVGVERVLAGQQRLVPDAALPFSPARRACSPRPRGRARLAGVGDDHADGADLDHGLGDQLHRGEQAVDVVGALDQHLELPAALAAGAQELLGVLEAVVVGRGVGRIVADGRRDDLARRAATGRRAR